jgi:hypothetical protein
MIFWWNSSRKKTAHARDLLNHATIFDYIRFLGSTPNFILIAQLSTVFPIVHGAQMKLCQHSQNVSKFYVNSFFNMAKFNKISYKEEATCVFLTDDSRRRYSKMQIQIYQHTIR